MKDVLRNPRLAAVLVLGLASGLPYNLTDATLQAWLKDSGISNTTIGVLSLVGLAYTLKPLWAPLLDRYVPPFLGRRRGWIVIFQGALAVALTWMAYHGPEGGLTSLALVALVVAVLSASQDIVIDAWRTDLVSSVERGPAATATNLGYRAASWFAFSGALILADFAGWRVTYLVMACCMAGFMFVTAFTPEPQSRVPPPRTLAEAVRGPLAQLLTNDGMLLLIAALVLYKVGDAFALKLFTPFLMDVGFTKTEIGAVTKTVMLIANIAGAVVGGLLMMRLGLVRALLGFGLLQAVANLGYAAVAVTGHDIFVMAIAVFVDNFVGAMGNTALVVFIMGLCDVRFSAFQYALLSALAVLPRNVLGAPAGFLSDEIGWAAFFVVTFFTALPGLAMVWWQRERIAALEHKNQ
ncbi:MAG: MFS transporter [Gammaproteobacteria bacterium]|jgi:PAT family beta-lactamase induction signal transducer AmpG|nr:MFS transporter [Gammaproteobacteria bacterium]